MNTSLNDPSPPAQNNPPSPARVRYQRLGITGNRPSRFNPAHHARIKEELATTLANFQAQGGTSLHHGAARGVDLWASLAAIPLGLTINTYLAFPEQASGWELASRLAFQHVLAHSDTITTVGNSWANRHYHERNQAIVRNADILLVVRAQGLEHGGAWATRQYGMRQGIPLIDLTVCATGQIHKVFYNNPVPSTATTPHGSPAVQIAMPL